ncbi:hypothetical protein H5410_026265 [Solanum commersonii]|uniref:Uncharacterized protein n=1 Tax=Solanum commersonii TaxID=4109 RepID=A0A9J5YY56_SOLCO|nr:hypothetical protein H5410_026265 [Solanum commersonii]
MYKQKNHHVKKRILQRIRRNSRPENESSVRKERQEYRWSSNGYADREKNSYGKIVYEEEEDVDAEANNFIKWEHDKFNRAKLMSLKSFY